MGFTVDEFNQAKSQMAAEFNRAITEADTRRKNAVRVSSDGCASQPANAPGKLMGLGVSAVVSPAIADNAGIQADEVK